MNKAEFQTRNGQTCIIRPATVEDVEFIGECCAAGLFNPGMAGTFAVKSRREDTLYSYRNTLIAEIDGTPIACAVSYEGNRFRKMCEDTWGRYVEQALPGEYHFDTVATKEEYRGQGIATHLINYVMEQARNSDYDFTYFTLVTEPENATAIRLYESLGFHLTGETRVENFLVMAKPRG